MLKLRIGPRMVVLGLTALLVSGCVERTLTINTNPQGARVFLNDEPVGVSPVTVDFRWYGDYNVQCRKDGYATLKTHQRLPAPWYDYFPFDFFAQILYPGQIEDHTNWTFNLETQTPMDRDTLIDHARAMRRQLDDPNAS